MSGGGEGHFLDDIPKSNRIWYALVLIKMACPLYTFSKPLSMCAPTCMCMFSVIITMHEGLDRKSYLLKSKVIFPHSWPCDSKKGESCYFCAWAVEGDELIMKNTVKKKRLCIPC